MIRLRSAAALLAAFILLFPASPASFAEDSVPEIEEIVLDDGTGAVSAETETDAEEPTRFTAPTTEPATGRTTEVPTYIVSGTSEPQTAAPASTEPQTGRQP